MGLENRSDPETANTPLAVRDRLEAALRIDLIGPGPNHPLAEERLPPLVQPSTWYLTGFLVPCGSAAEAKCDPLEDEDDDALAPEQPGLFEESTEDRRPKKRGYFPSSMGLSFLVDHGTTELEVAVRFGEYTCRETEDDEGKPVRSWHRKPFLETLRVSLAGQEHPAKIPVPNSGGIVLQFFDRPIPDRLETRGIPSGARSVSVFLVNERPPNPADEDTQRIFQAELEVRTERSFLPRPDLSGARAEEWDDQVADLHYAGTPEYATGHGVSTEWNLEDGRCAYVRTTWIPRARVEKTETSDIPGVALSMTELGELRDGKSAAQILSPLIVAYRLWIEEQRAQIAGSSQQRQETAQTLLVHAEHAARRIASGIALLASDAQAFDAFRVANRAVARALRQRLKEENPRWRAFQLAFILQNLVGLANPRSADRDIVDLLFFPTGGGKTEAYLGLAAFTMVLRRLRNPGDSGRAGGGVSVIMRYTLRLLTLDQLGRAAGLVCALEMERRRDASTYGTWPFEIGLWVGKATTPNALGEKGDDRKDTARAKTRDYQSNPERFPSPIPLDQCPWCGAPFGPESFQLRPNHDRPTRLDIVCLNFECAFSGDNVLPIVAIDDPLYRRLPAFLIATLDKFASLPWVGASGALLGGASRYDEHGFYGANDPGRGQKLSSPLPPPDLIIQDELHLISGPLGTMAGLYETAIEALCIRTCDGQAVRPHIVASTATVRRAQDQIQSLFGRSLTQIFPPPGPDRRDSFFAKVRPESAKPARRYLGIAAPGRSPKVVMRRVYLALMGAAEQAYGEAGGPMNLQNPADPYMTVLGYFNALRELGGARRILEEEVQHTLQSYGHRKRLGESRGLFESRKDIKEVVELTSRVSTNDVASARARLGLPFHDPHHVDCAIATNMISVGLDIPRLGLMVVNGQPKSHAEYIQATSRVGRTDQSPGLVVTLLNVHKPRDRSHFERFRHYHETFYRSVEASSVTPFAARALDRGFPGTLVALARHLVPELTGANSVKHIGVVRAELENDLVRIITERVREQPFTHPDELQDRLRSVQNRIVDLLDAWQKLCAAADAISDGMRYQKYEGRSGGALLHDLLDCDSLPPDERKFRVPRSLRDVEPTVGVLIKELSGRSLEGSA